MLVRFLAISTALIALSLAPLAAAQADDNPIREYEERDLVNGQGGLTRPDLPYAPTKPLAPGLTVIEDIDGPEAQEMVLEILDTFEWLLDSFQMPGPVTGEQRLAIERARAQMLLVPEEELQTFAQTMGPNLISYHRVIRLQRSAMKSRADGELVSPFSGAMAKSSGFPTLRNDLPGYPAGGSTQGYSASENELETEQAEIETEIEARDGAAAADTNFFCDSTLSGGRAGRQSASALFTQRDILLVADIIYEVANDICGGFSGGVSIFSAEYSCDICCIISDVLHALSVWLYDQQILCEDLIDSAEVEAAYHNSLGIFDGVQHVHEDLGTSGSTTVKNEIDDNEALINEVDDHLGTTSVKTVKDEIDENEVLIIAVDGKADVIIDQTACHPVVNLVRQGGCNGNDDDCDKSVDECDEDVFGPALHVDEAVAGPWYASMADAAAAVQRATFAEDDCQSLTLAFDPLSGSCGSVVANVTATDACGNATTVSTIVKVDGTAPTVSIDPSVDGSCHASIADAEAAVLAAATISDDCDTNLDVRVDSTVTECALRVRIEAIDAAGHRSVDAVTVRVDDGAPGLEIERLLLGIPAPCFSSVAEAEAAVAGIVKTDDNCSAAADLPVVISSAGDPCSLVVTADTTDECGGPATDSLTLRVDPNPPTVSCATTIDTIDSSNHEMVNVGFSYAVADDCTGSPTVRINVTSDEATASAPGAGGSTHAPDAQILRDLSGNVIGIALRAERSSSGNGRVYTIVVEAMDPCGNVAVSSCQVSVPPNGNGVAVDDGQFYDATAVN